MKLTGDYTRRNIDDDLEARARELDADAIGWRRKEIGFWILSSLALAGMFACVGIDVVPQWAAIADGLVCGHILARATTARRRRRRAVQESARLRSIADRRRLECN